MGCLISYCCSREYFLISDYNEIENLEDKDFQFKEEVMREYYSSKLNFYTLGKEIGYGSTSKVFIALRKHGPHAYDERSMLACKVINKKRLLGLSTYKLNIDSILLQLRKEISILKNIDHPNIVRFEDFIETDGG